MKRKKVNTQITKDIHDYWTAEKKENILKRIRKSIFIEIGPFEKLEEPKVQTWAHKMIPGNDLLQHADRLYVKTSIRKYLRQQIINHLGLQKYFPELYEENKKDETKL